MLFKFLKIFISRWWKV